MIIKGITGYSIKQWLMALWVFIDTGIDKFNALDRETKADVIATALGTIVFFLVVFTACLVGWCLWGN